MRPSLLVALLLLPAVAQPAGRRPSEGAWASRYPQAARGLVAWKAQFPNAAHQLRDWDGQEPAHSREFLTWTLTHAGDNFDLFVLGHRDWSRLRQLLEQEHPAMDAFARWLQGDPSAGRALASRLRALSRELGP